METSGWVAVRCVLGHVVDSGQIYEERVTLWRTGDIDVAIGRAEVEVERYAEDIDATYVGLAQAYLLSDDVSDGAEIFSMMRGSDLEPQAYLDRFFDTGTERQRHLG